MSSAVLAAPPFDPAAGGPTGARASSGRNAVHDDDSAVSLRLIALCSALFLHLTVAMWMAGTHTATPVDTPVLMQASLIAPEPLPLAAPEPQKDIPRVDPRPVRPAKQPVTRREETTLPRPLAATDAHSDTGMPPQPVVSPEPSPVDAAMVSTPAPQASAPVAAPLPVSPPRFDAAYLDNPQPPYPPMSKRTGEEGRVLLWVMVDADGSPSKVEVKTSSGSPRLDQAALEAVRKWTFVPARRGSEAVAAPVLVPVSFSLTR